MAIAFIKERKRQRYLVLIAVGVVVASVIVLYFGYFRGTAPHPSITAGAIVPYREIQINFDVLDNPLLKIFQPFEKISPFEGVLGRDNPFLPY